MSTGPRRRGSSADPSIRERSSFAWFAGAGALSQMWLFIVAPITGAVIAGASYARITGAPSASVGVAQNPELEERRQTA